MTRKTSADCANCRASYELTVWDLGSKESDSISCPCCGELLREWKNESHSFSITGEIRKGNLRLTEDSLPSYIGKRIRIEKGTEVFEGVVKGLGESLMATGATTVGRPWLLETANGDIEFMPTDMWRISNA
jgi:hypothetical protein